MSDSNNNVIVGEHDSNRFSLEQRLEDIRDVDFDPYRIKTTRRKDRKASAA